MNNLPNLSFIDLETTGLNRQKHEILELAIIRVRQPMLKIIDEWEAKIQPQKINTADPQALKINNYNEKDWEKALSPKLVFEKFSQKARDTMLVAHNINFDVAFLEDNFRNWKVPISWDHHTLDTVSLAYFKLGPNTKLKLSELALKLNIKQEKAHSALSDARTCFEVFKRLINSDW